MYGRLFTLMTDDDMVFAWGMEIKHPGGCAAVIYRWDPTTQKSTQGVHKDADGARVLYAQAAGVELTIVWMDLRAEIERLYALLDAEAALMG